MLVYNELRLLPDIMKSSGSSMSWAAGRSLKELLDALRLMPSAPQVHPGVCDYAPAFRSAIGDIYNSITGLSLCDVTGQNGLALSKHVGPADYRNDVISRDVHELPGSTHQLITKGALVMSNETITLHHVPP